MNEEGMFYTLVDDEGVETEFELLETLEFEGNKYFAMCELTEDYDEASEAVFDILRADRDADGEEILVTLEDEDLRQKIGELFTDMLNEE
ncbi:MAG: DUF1292 domain-containing protein [Ruminococcus sp.]|jgi:uncharacterized protein YrzB (UPF0473 family)|nr:DUF1292 domain-containing protein [Ruminococcus sp.]